MCGIAGSKSRESGYDLYKNNLCRGYYSSSVTALYPQGHFVLKKEGELSLEEVPVGADFYLFHSRGPTVETIDFNWDDNHPFTYGRFIVAHNGIIENANELYGKDIGVDSRVIPWLLDKNLREHPGDYIEKVILDTVNQLQGTFGLWIYDTTTGYIHVVRHDITLFKYGTEFASSNPGYMVGVPQDAMFRIDRHDPSNTMQLGAPVKLAKKPKYFIASPPK